MLQEQVIWRLAIFLPELHLPPMPPLTCVRCCPYESMDSNRFLRRFRSLLANRRLKLGTTRLMKSSLSNNLQ